MVGFEKVANGTKGSLPSAKNTNTTNRSPDAILNLVQGDPTVFEPYWRNQGDKCTLLISGSDFMSYYSDCENICWFLQPQLADAIRNIHRDVGNAVLDGRHIVIGAGSTQLFQAAVYALSSPAGPEPISVVSAAPYYSRYPEEIEFLSSGLYKWGGDANTFDKDGPYIEVVNSPNNPDGTSRDAVVNRSEGRLIHDCAYYWPHYTPITGAADHNVMLFTLSKCTGHAGSRIGWAIVKDIEVAKKMIKFVEFNSLGVCKESQLRAAKILETISNEYSNLGCTKTANFFEYGQRLMAERWRKLREVIKRSKVFSLPEYPKECCNFSGEFMESHPAFAWLQSKGNMDAEKLLRSHKMMGKGGKYFGVDSKYARVSVVGREEDFNLLLERLWAIKGEETE
ncbi:hypothetical protein Pint_22903 [Pistacia integerrima]|uniref:Uncharacterized protein n=1 Tax=Pistacia integerrima TaxID=434235 RepID=A0ACC0YLY5_9ROSI|nr:hypothetical protein Pint_22903 [Pistacia integerrima]